MDPVSIILSALVAGSTAAAKDTVSEAVKDAFSSLKGLVQRRLRGNAVAETALSELEKDPETWEKPVAKSLAEHGLGEDDAALSLAQRLLDLLEESQPSGSKYRVQIEHGQGVVIGDQADVRISFGQPSSEGQSSKK